MYRSSLIEWLLVQSVNSKANSTLNIPVNNRAKASRVCPAAIQPSTTRKKTYQFVRGILSMHYVQTEGHCLRESPKFYTEVQQILKIECEDAVCLWKMT